MVDGDAGLLKNVKNEPGGDIIPFFFIYLHSKRTIIMDMKILVKQGIGDIRFKMPVEEVVALLGTADEVENIDNAADEPTTVLRYNDLGLTLFFEGENPVLACIDICNEESEMLGEQVFEMEEPALVQLMVKKQGLTLEGAAARLAEDRRSVEKRVKALNSLKEIRAMLVEVRKAL